MKRDVKRNPVIQKKDIPNHPDNKIDEDFEGYPHGPAKDETIKPETKKEKKVAGVNNKDGEKRNYKKEKKVEEQQSDGSANAFEDK